jgi:hypothetical protein
MSDTAEVGRKREGPPGRRPLIDDELAGQLLGRAQAEGAELLGPDGLLSQVTKAVLERALAEEMTGHLGYEKHDPAGRGSGSSRNGMTPKTVLTDVGRWTWRSRGIGTGRSSRRSSARARPAWTDSTSGSSRCTRGA